MTAIDWGWGIQQTAERLIELSEKAQENGDEYALRRAQQVKRSHSELVRSRLN